MAYKVAIISSNGNDGNGINEKNYTESISKYISNRLNVLGVENFLVNENKILTDEEKVDIIKNKYGNGNNIIVISNELNNSNDSGTNINYALRNNNKLAFLIADNIENNGGTVNKYYQLRDATNTALDANYIIRNTANNQSIIIDYGSTTNINDANFLKDNYENLAEAVVKSISDYAGISYLPSNMDGYYIVKKGDSLWSIASRNNTTVDNLKKINNLKSNTLKIGQLLKLPSIDNNVESNENIYTVKKGDNLYAIANKYNVSVDDLKSANNLASNLLSIGQTLIIPTNTINITNEVIYTVKKGDSLWSIANKFDTTVNIIKSTNNLTSNTLQIGQTLVIPSTSEFTNYIVQKGDTLYSIANKYNTTVDNIKKINNLSSNTLSIGQKLIISS